MYIPHGESQKIISVRMYITNSQSKEYVSVLCTSHTVNLGKTFPFGRKSHTVLCVGSCVKGVSITHEPIHKPVWDVQTNRNVFPGLTVWDVHKNGNVILGWNVCDIHTTEMIFWDSPCGMYIAMEMISGIHRVGCTYLRK